MTGAFARTADTRSDQPAILAAVCLAALVLPLDFSGAAAATPVLARAFEGSPVMLGFVVNAFMLTFGSTLLTAGALADAYGRRRVFVAGVAGFVVVSVAICLAGSLLVLDILRALQGVAAAATLAGGSAALAQEFDGPARTRAFSLLGTTFGTGLAFGPTIAGLLIAASGWRAIFLASAAVGALALALGASRLRETRDPEATGPDWWGALSFTTALAFLTFGLVLGPDDGWGLGSRACLGAAAAALAAFVTIERRVARPMLHLGLFRYRRFVGVQLLPVATCTSYVVLLVLLPARLIGIEGLSPLAAGLLMLALSAPMLVVPMMTALLVERLGAARLSAIGLVVAAAGLAWLARIAPGTTTGGLVAPLVVIGFGTAMPWGLMDGLSVAVVPKERAGMATGIFSTVRVAGEGIALAITRAMLAGLTETHLGGVPAAASRADALAAGDLARAAALAPPVAGPALAAAFGTAFGQLLALLAAIVIAAAALAFVLLRDPLAPAPGDPTL